MWHEDSRSAAGGRHRGHPAAGAVGVEGVGLGHDAAIVDVASREVEDYVLAGDRVWGAALNHDDSLLVVTNGASDNITIIDTDDLRAINSISVGRTPHTVRIDD